MEIDSIISFSLHVRKLRCRNSGSFPGSHGLKSKTKQFNFRIQMLSLKRMVTGLWEKPSIHCKANLGGEIFFFFWFVLRNLHPADLVRSQNSWVGVRILAKDTCRVSWEVEGTTVARERPGHQSPPALYPPPLPPCQESSRMKGPQRFRTLHFHPPGALGVPFWGGS